jgi:hypothetical protein
MPAVTRSQSKINQNANVVQCNTEFFAKLPSIDTTTQNIEIFAKYLKKMLDLAEYYQINQVEFRLLAKKETSSIRKNELYTYMYKQFYYDTIRVVTEMYYAVVDWFDAVFVINSFVPVASFQKLINKIYNKSFQFEEEIKNAPADQTEEHQYVIKVFQNQLKETREALEPYTREMQEPFTTGKIMTSKRCSNRKRNQVNYAWMDPLDENTDIWADTTIDTDPDYEPSEEEAEEEEAEEEEAEEEEAEEEEAEEEAAEDFVVERVSSNHIRFMY